MQARGSVIALQVKDFPSAARRRSFLLVLLARDAPLTTNDITKQAAPFFEHSIKRESNHDEN
jgi:hypothetical protein